MKTIDEIIESKLKKLDRVSDIGISAMRAGIIRGTVEQLLKDAVREVLEELDDNLEIVSDFVERWDKQDKEADVAQAVQDLNQKIKDISK